MSELDDIEQNHQGCIGVFQTWYETKRCPYTWYTLLKGCLISLTSSTYSTNISLMCSPVCSSTVIGCTYDIPSGIYNMCVYDIKEENTLSDDWAISSTNITITGVEQIYPYLLHRL